MVSLSLPSPIGSGSRPGRPQPLDSTAARCSRTSRSRTHQGGERPGRADGRGEGDAEARAAVDAEPGRQGEGQRRRRPPRWPRRWSRSGAAGSSVEVQAGALSSAVTASAGRPGPRSADSPSRGPSGREYQSSTPCLTFCQVASGSIDRVARRRRGGPSRGTPGRGAPAVRPSRPSSATIVPSALIRTAQVPRAVRRIRTSSPPPVAGPGPAAGLVQADDGDQLAAQRAEAEHPRRAVREPDQPLDLDDLGHRFEPDRVAAPARTGRGTRGGSAARGRSASSTSRVVPRVRSPAVRSRAVDLSAWPSPAGRRPSVSAGGRAAWPRGRRASAARLRAGPARGRRPRPVRRPGGRAGSLGQAAGRSAGLAGGLRAGFAGRPAGAAS